LPKRLLLLLAGLIFYLGQWPAARRSLLAHADEVIGPPINVCFWGKADIKPTYPNVRQ
jgi:hypothetical protein